MVEHLIGNYGEYLKEHFQLAAVPQCRVQLPVIPLGVHCADFDPPEEKKAALRKQWRDKMQITDDAVAFLFVGRLSFHGKAHPMPMFLALERAAALSSMPLHLILSGWFSSESQQKDFIEAAREFCPSVRVHIVDGRVPEVRQAIWHAADVFTSLSDNIQETFGLTPVEAMAAGLPGVVSDWDGYKETVREGIDGFRVPTWMASPGSAEKLAFGHATKILSYDQYIGFQSQFTSVDVAATASAYSKLANDPYLRKQMGEAARLQAKTVFDWQVIITQYQDLWRQLAVLRQDAAEATPRKTNSAANPLRDDPTNLFQSYPSHHLTGDTLVAQAPGSSADLIGRYKRLTMNRLADEVASGAAQSVQLLQRLTPEFRPVQTLLQQLPDNQHRTMMLTLLWLSKMGLVVLQNK